jgi:uncharacterized protein (DUF1800 family)
MSDFFLDEASFAARFRWPVEHVVGLLKAAGPGTAPLLRAVQALSPMGQDLYDPPSVEGYNAGATWINSSTMLSRANYGAVVGAAQAEALAADLAATPPATPEALVDHFLGRMGPVTAETAVRAELVAFVRAGRGTPWTGAPDQLRAKIPGLIHLIAGTGDYAFV